MYSLYLQFALQSMYGKLGYQRSGKATPIPKTSVDEWKQEELNSEKRRILPSYM